MQEIAIDIQAETFRPIDRLRLPAKTCIVVACDVAGVACLDDRSATFGNMEYCLGTCAGLTDLISGGSEVYL